MKEVDLMLSVLTADYGVEVDLTSGASTPAIEIVARSDDLPHRFPLRIYLAEGPPHSYSGEALIPADQANVLRPRRDQYSGYCAFVKLPHETLLQVAPLVLSETLSIVGCKADRLQDGNSFLLKSLSFLAESDVEDAAAG